MEPSLAGIILGVVRLGRSLILGLLGVVAACSYYDRSLLEADLPSDANGGGGGSAGEGGAGEGGGGEGGVPGGAGGSAGVSAAGTSAGEAGSSGTPAGGGPVCQLAKPPGPPATATPGGDLELLMALKTVDFGENAQNGQDGFKSIGFDLDGYCTCPDDSSCKVADKDPLRYCDGDGGRDNSGGALISFVSKFSPKLSTQAINDQLADGAFSLILRIRGYNGEANDEQVELAWLIAASYSKNHPNGTKPNFDGSDEWTLVDTSFSLTNGQPDPEKPAFADKNAYVTNFTVVGSLPGGTLQFSGFTLELTNPFLVGKLVPPNDVEKFWTSPEGIIAARWKTKNLLGQLGQFEDPILKKPLCTDNQVFQNLKDQICQYADITSTLSPPNTPCDALSLGFKVIARQAKVKGMVPLETDPPPCPPETDPSGVSCGDP